MEVGGSYEETSRRYRNFPQRKALVVDERPDGLEYYAAMLEAYGYQVRRCGAYCEGVRCMGSETFAFVIVSQGTPKFEGSCVLKRAVEIDRSLPVFAVARCLDMGSYMEAMPFGGYRLFRRTLDGLGGRPAAASPAVPERRGLNRRSDGRGYRIRPDAFCRDV